MLSNFDLEELCQKLDLPLIGVYNKDQLPYQREVGSYYINMENHDAGEGTHWVLAKIYCDEDTQSYSKYKKINDWLEKFLFVSLNKCDKLLDKDAKIFLYLCDIPNCKNFY